MPVEIEERPPTPAPPAAVDDPEALIREARNRQRRRRRKLFAALLLFLAASAAAAYAIIRTTSHGASTNVHEPSRATVAVSASVTPDQPVAVAVSPSGRLFIADRGRNEILEWMQSGEFHVVAGTGVAGWSGDGGPAVHAEIDNPSSLAVAANGTLYFAQAGRYRAPLKSSGGMLNTVIREITPHGTIGTLAGLHPSCARRPVVSIPAESARFYGASLFVSPTGGLKVDARLCVGNTSEPGFGPNLLLASSRRFIKDRSNSAPAAASIACGSGVSGSRFRAFACLSGGGLRPNGHGRELLVVHDDGSSSAYPAHRAVEFAVRHGEVIATHDWSLVRVTSSGLIPLATTRQVQRALGLKQGTRALTDLVAPAFGPSGDIYFVASTISRLGCQNDIVERIAAGGLRRIWGSWPSKNNVCF